MELENEFASSDLPLRSLKRKKKFYHSGARTLTNDTNTTALGKNKTKTGIVSAPEAAPIPYRDSNVRKLQQHQQ